MMLSLKASALLHLLVFPSVHHSSVLYGLAMHRGGRIISANLLFQKLCKKNDIIHVFTSVHIFSQNYILPMSVSCINKTNSTICFLKKSPVLSVVHCSLVFS